MTLADPLEIATQDAQGITRRAILARFGAIAGMTYYGAAATKVWAAVEASIDPSKVGLNTLAALAETYQDLPGWPADWNARAAEDQLRRRYRDGGDAYRRWVTVLLDTIEAAPTSGKFSALSVPERRAALKAWMTAPDPDAAMMHRPRPSDRGEPASIAAGNLRNTALIQARMASLSDDDKRLDPVTGLPRYSPPAQAIEPITRGGPLDTEGRQLRHLQHCAFELLASLMSDDDPRATSDHILMP